MARQLRYEQAPTREEQRRDPEPVRGSTAEAVDEHERLALTSDQVAQAAATHLGEALLQAFELDLCVRHHGRLFLDGMNRLGRQDP